MSRALSLARNGEGRVSPNPMVGAVIVNDGRIIGEGFHQVFGGPHAEVNAINSVKPEDRKYLTSSTIYVTLEPCAHYGKTPPCVDLILKTGIKRVVVGAWDPNPLVAGKGLERLKNNDVEVTSGVLENECIDLNSKFFKAFTSSRPWILLKWAQSADGFIAALDENNNPKSVKFSSPLSTCWMHRLRASVDAILVGSNTEKIDHPLLTVRSWSGDSPKKIVATNNLDLQKFVMEIRKEGITSIMVEGGAKLLQSFIDNDLFDEIRIETSPIIIGNGIKSPKLPDNIKLFHTETCRNNLINWFRR